MKKRIRIVFLTLLTIAILFQHSCRKIPEPAPHIIPSVFEECITTGNNSSFEIVTINLKGFPKEGLTTISIVKEMIDKINPDVIAMQEVSNEADFDNLVSELDGWEGRFYPVLNSIYNLAYLVKSSEITIDDSKTRMILTNDFYAFPRAPFEIYVTHKTLNISTYLINLHLKCCTDGVAQRTDAATKLDNYIKSTRLSDPVIILGDFNDIISGTTAATNVFYNFVSAQDEYLFTDMNIAKGNSLYWSYPSWPSHIDHVLVTNELFSRVDTTMVLRPESCYNLYSANISDHRPVEIILK
jgi:endonuclease/exonuclease/phosphatase family metal-dependent hydrolase